MLTLLSSAMLKNVEQLADLQGIAKHLESIKQALNSIVEDCESMMQ